MDEDESGITITLTRAINEVPIAYSPAPAQIILGYGVAKNYDGYRMLWKPEQGFVAIYPGKEDPRNSEKPGPELIIRFREDLAREAAGNPDLGQYLARNPTLMKDDRSSTYRDSCKMPPDRFARASPAGDLPLPHAFKAPHPAKPDTTPDPKKRIR